MILLIEARHCSSPYPDVCDATHVYIASNRKIPNAGARAQSSRKNRRNKVNWSIARSRAKKRAQSEAKIHCGNSLRSRAAEKLKARGHLTRSSFIPACALRHTAVVINRRASLFLFLLRAAINRSRNARSSEEWSIAVVRESPSDKR